MNDTQNTPKPKPKPAKLFMKQKNMLRVVYSLIPLAVSAVYFFGWRVVAILAVVFGCGLVTEYITSKQRGAAISMACLVTCSLYGLSLPVTVPYWIAAVGIIVAILFGKEVFGGFGRNFANPAIVGRAFVYVCFPVALTAKFVPAFKGFPGGFTQWSMEHFVQTTGKLPEYIAVAGGKVADAVSQASPLWVSREFGVETSMESASILDLFLGSIGGIFQSGSESRVLASGSMGEGCALLIILAGVYLLVTKTANWRLMLSGLIGLVFANVLFRDLLGYAGVGEVPPIYVNLFGGTTMYVIVFMVTCPVTSPKNKLAMLAYGFFIGFMTVFLRWRNIFVAAASFAILLGNIISPLLDLGADALTKRSKPVAAKAKSD